MHIIKFKIINKLINLKFIIKNIKIKGSFWILKSNNKIFLFINSFNLNIHELKGKIPILTNNIKINIFLKLNKIKKMINIEENTIIIK